MGQDPSDVVTVYTDGACLGNPGPGGFAALILDGTTQELIARGFHRTTNNRMELMAALEALRRLSGQREVRLFSDSQYLINGMAKGWAKNWQRRGWRRPDGNPALNRDLWEQLLEASEPHHVEWHWVRGHGVDPLNDFCDRIAVEYATEHATEKDLGFEEMPTFGRFIHRRRGRR